ISIFTLYVGSPSGTIKLNATNDSELTSNVSLICLYAFSSQFEFVDIEGSNSNKLTFEGKSLDPKIQILFIGVVSSEPYCKSTFILCLNSLNCLVVTSRII